MSDVNIGNDEGGGPDYPPYREDFFQRIVNVNWQKSVSVEFTGYGNLTLHSGITGLSKSIISLWFRIPQQTFDVAFNAWADKINSSDNSDFTLLGVIPLLVWGPPDTITTYSDSGPAYATDGPSFIGVYIGTYDEHGNPIKGLSNIAMRFQSSNNSVLAVPPGPAGPGGPYRAEGNFYAIGKQDSIHTYTSTSSKNSTIFMDAWHHLLVSFDVTGTTGVLWYALDDTNYDSGYLYPAAPINMIGFSGGPNDIVATYDWPIYSSAGTATSGGFTMNVNPFAVPIINNMASTYGFEPIEMADLQIFTGLTLDTSIISNRRAFVDRKGKPVDANSQSGSVKLLRKQPDVLFSNLSDWLSGHNKGTAGHFDYAPFIRKFKLDPQLGS